MKMPAIAAILLCAISAPDMVLAQPNRPVLSVSMGEYFGTVYTDTPPLPAQFVHFRGEPLRLRVTIANEGDDTELGIAPGFSRPFTAALVPHDASLPGPEVNFIWERPVRRRGGRGRIETPVDLPAPLGRDESMWWLTTLTGLESVTAGVYRIVLVPRIASTNGRPFLVNNDGLTIELRDVKTSSDRLEVLRVRGTRAFAQKDWAASERFLREMISMYPSSGFAYLLLGDVAVARKAVDEARTQYSKALELLRSGADRLFSEVNSRQTVDETIAALSRKISSLDRP